VVNKSTVPVGSGDYVSMLVQEGVAEVANDASAYRVVDLKRRCPEIRRAREALGWEPRTPVREGLKKTLSWFAERSGSPEASSAKR
jgi:nucleoside-diphosphate-sugar epimerase